MSKHFLGRGALGLLLLIAFHPVARADQAAAPRTEWVYPVISGHGRVHPRPDLPVRLDPAQDYRILVQVVSVPDDPSKPNGALERLARVVNLMGYAGVPREHVHIVAVLDKAAGASAATDDAYKAQFKVDHNPNLPVLHALKQAGVELMVCGQALAEQGLPDEVITPDVTVTLSALTDFVVYGQQGYSFMQL